MQRLIFGDAGQQRLFVDRVDFVQQEQAGHSRFLGHFDCGAVGGVRSARRVGNQQQQIALGETRTHLAHHLLVQARFRLLNARSIEKNNLGRGRVGTRFVGGRSAARLAGLLFWGSQRFSAAARFGAIERVHFRLQKSDHALNGGAGGLRFVGDDGYLGADQRVHERRLAGVGASENGHKTASGFHGWLPVRCSCRWNFSRWAGLLLSGLLAAFRHWIG